MQRVPPGIGNNYIIPGYQQSVPCQQYPYASNFNFPNSVIPGTLPCSQSLTDYVITTTSTMIPGFCNDVSIMSFGQGPTSQINSVPRSTPAISSHAVSSSNSQITVSTDSIRINPTPVSSASPINHTPVSSASQATVVNPIGIENSCLSFVRSLMFRISKDDVVQETITNFPLSDIKEAREILFKQTGTKLYRYQGPKDPATVNDKSKHAVMGIIQKVDDLNNSGVSVKFYNSAEDLFRLSRMMIGQSTNKVSEDFSKDKFDEMSRRLNSLEFDMRYIKSLPHNLNPAATPMPRYLPVTNRQNIFKQNDFPNLNSPVRPKAQAPIANSASKRRRTSVGGNIPLSNNTDVPRGSPAWKTVQKKRNKPDTDHVPKGRPPPERQSQSHEIFLFRYMEDETPSSILNYFKGVGVSSAHHVRYRCSPYSQTKNFVMKFRDMNELKYIIRGLPEYTGCRPYCPEPPGENERPRGYFNYGGTISGPDVESFLYDDEGETSSRDMDISDNSVNTSSAPFTSDAVAAALSDSLASVTNTSSNITIAGASISTSTDSGAPSSVIISSNSTSVSTSTPSPITTSAVISASSSRSPPPTSVSILDSITRLDSPHMQTESVRYESVVHEA